MLLGLEFDGKLAGRKNRYSSSMKIDDGPLNRYLIKNLQPLTEADPSLLANYVAALLKNNKPKNELQKLCVDQLYDFLGDGTKSFVAKLFQSIEDGTVPSSPEEMETSKAIESVSAITSTDVVELRASPPHLERLPSTAVRSFSEEGEDESSDDEDDDRNHKHRRRVSRSRSFDRDGEDEGDRGLYRKRGRVIDNGQLHREADRQGNERKGPGHALQADRDALSKFDRRLGREQGSSRFNADGGQRGMRTGPQFREGVGPRFEGPNGLIRGNMGRGRGIIGVWAPHDQRFPVPPFADGAEFAPPLLPPGPAAGFFPGRGLPGRSGPHTPWSGYGPLPGMGNGPLEHPHPLSAGMQVARGPSPISAGMGMGMNISMGRPRCLDFEERGYCLRGDLCPMEHGANRIVVEDVQSLSKFNLPVSLPGGRGLAIVPGSGPTSGTMVPSGLSLVNRTNQGTRETNVTAAVEDPAVLNGVVPGSAGAEPDSYDPDQPLWNKAHPETSSGLRKLPSFQKGSHDQEWEGDSVDKREDRDSSESMDAGRLLRLGGNTNGGPQTGEGGPSVWDRIGPVVSGVSRLDGSLRTSTSVDLLQTGKLLRKDSSEEVPSRQRGPWQGKWNREMEGEEETGARVSASTLSMHSRGRGSARGEPGPGQRSGEGTSYGSRGTGGRNSSERAQRTLYVSLIPPNSNRSELLLAHFQKFGDVLDVRIPAHTDRAFVQFSRREDAESALTAPDAVMGNRFIRLSWANRDSIPDVAVNAASTSGGRAVKSSPGVAKGPAPHMSKGLDQTTRNGSSSLQPEGVPTEATGKLVAANGSSSSVFAGPSVKKQEELERMREEIRKKQEALAQKRVDFRRKLDQLAKQGPAQGETSDSEQRSKRQKIDDTEEIAGQSWKNSVTQPSPMSSGVPIELSSPSAALSKTNSGDVLKQSVVPTTVQPAQPSPRGGRLPPTRSNNTYTAPVAWGPARFKLDNRTTIFRVIPPFPAAVIDVGILKEHFMMFGELASVDVEDAEGIKMEGSTKLSETNTVRVSFGTRRAAERAFSQGRWLQGQNLQLVWVTSPGIPTACAGTASTRTDSLGEKSSLGTPKNLAGLPSSAELEGVNGSRSQDCEITGHDEETQVTDTDRNILVEEVAGAGGMDEKKLSNTVQTLDWRRDTGLHVPVFPKSVRSTGSSVALVEGAIESSLASGSTGVSNLSL